MQKINLKEIPEAIEHWEKMLVAYKEQASRAYIKGSDYLPLQMGWSNKRSVEWIEDELRMLREMLSAKPEGKSE